MRPDLAAAVTRSWLALAGAGTWFTGAERLEIAAEVRNARQCKLCAERKSALSPYTVAGVHDRIDTPTDAYSGPGSDVASEALSASMVEAIHRLSTDAGRITQSWIESLQRDGLQDCEYVEIIGVVALITALDTLDYALDGTVDRALPEAEPGTPDRHRPPGAVRDLAWVATLSPETLSPGDPDPFSRFGAVNIHRAISLVPQAVIDFFDLDEELYLPDDQIRDFDNDYRAISHAQIELMAGRTSALHGCYY